MQRPSRFFLPAFLFVVGCSSAETAKSDEPETQGPAVEAAFDRSQPDTVPSDQPGHGRTLRAHLNLLNLAHMADVYQDGLFIDFGTPARNKYTVGNWRTGWGKDGVENGVPYSYVASNAGRVYLPLPTDRAVKLVFRLKAIGTGMMQLYLNNKPLPATPVRKGEGFATYEVKVPRKLVKEGENYLLLRLGDTVKRNGEEVSVAVDYLHVVPDSVAGSGADGPVYAKSGTATDSVGANERLPRYGRLVQDVELSGTRRKALELAAPGTLSFHVHVPKDAQLSLRAGAPSGTGLTAKVTVTPEHGSARTIWEKPLSGSWQDATVSLAEYAGQVVKLALSGEGSGGVAWASPAIMVPKVELAASKPSKNTIVLLIDTLRASKLKPYNPKTVVKTPALDALAKEGTIFTAAQSPENWTKPSVASVLTGLYPLTHGTKRTESKLSDSALMVSEVFQDAGYKTATFLANGYVSDKFGFKQGWDHYTNYIRERKSTEARNVFGEAATWIEKNKDKPFFVYIQTIDPHVPYDPPKEFLDMYDAAPYDGIVSSRKTPDLLEKAKRNPPKITFTARDKKRVEALHNAEISYHDRYLEQFIAKLRELGLYDDLMFVVTSDHGEEFYEHKSYGHGHSVYQELINVPMMFRMPGTVPAGKRIDETVGTLDITPTVLAAAGIDVPKVMEGRDRMAHIRGDVPAGPAVAFTDFLTDRHVVRAGRYKLILRGTNATLFDLKKDPWERAELDHRKYPVAMRYCRTMLGQFLGASDRRNWLAAEQKDVAGLQAEETNIDQETSEQLKALGYAH